MQRIQTINRRINQKFSNYISILQWCKYISINLQVYVNKFILLLGKCVYPYKYMDSWEICDETTLAPKLLFHSNLNLENFSNEDISMLKMYGTYLK